LLELSQRERVMVMLDGSTGLRRGELIALRWRDIDFELMQADVTIPFGAMSRATPKRKHPSSEFHCAKTAHLYSNYGDAETHRSICRLSEEKPESDSTHGWRQESFAWLKTRHGVAGSLRTSPDCDFRGPLLSLVATRFLFQGRGFRTCRAPHTACCCTSRR